jgi:TolB-like protein/class 3 adenylate cyclase
MQLQTFARYPHAPTIVSRSTGPELKEKGFLVAEHPTRKLAVILHADVVGSTRLVQQNETLAHARIQDAFRRFSSTIEAYNGVTHELRGDALVAEFARASDAVAAGLAFQIENTESNARLEDDLQPRLRIGISLGEVVIADNTVTGAGVVLAQRVEQLAEPGGVCITGAVHEAAPQYLPLHYSDLGKQEVKGFGEPVQVYSASVKAGEQVPLPEPAASGEAHFRKPKRLWTASAIALLILVAGALAWWQPWKPEFEPSSMERMAFPVPNKPSIAVLPFTNMSDDPEQEYFADGITDDLTTDLSLISGLMVIARNSSFTYKGRAVNVQEVGRELGVRYVLEGSVRRFGDRVRINAQLIDTQSGMHVWANRYDRDITDVLVLQDEVTRTIVDALAVQLTPVEERILSRTRTVNADAYDLLLRGNEHRHRFTAEENAISRELYQQAIELDPDYARAYANLGLAYSNDVEFAWTDDIEGSIQKGLESSEIALALDDSIPQIHFTRANLYLILRRHKAAVAASRRSIEVDPNFADGYGILAHILIYAGEHESALHAVREAKRLNPHVSFIYLWVEARALFFMGRNEEALELVREAVERNSNFSSGRLLLAAILGQLGREEDANWEAEEILALKPDFSITSERQQVLYKRPQDLDRYLEGLRKAGLPE